MARRKQMATDDRRRNPQARGRKKGGTSALLAAAGVLAMLAAEVLWLWPILAADATEVLVYKSSTCGCCKLWIDYLEDNGFRVKSENVADLNRLKASHGVTPRLASCHTAVVEGYVLEGHVPAEDIRRLLAERPKVKGLAVPGMPAGSPGMGAPRKDAYETLTFDGQGRTAVFARH